MKTILVIDDNDLVRKSVAAYLADELQNTRILTASNGLEGEQVLGAHAVDLILTDLVMPVMDGATFIRKTARRFPHIPIIVMTADRYAGNEERLAALGVRGFFEKPFPYDVMVQEVSEVLCRHSFADDSDRMEYRRCAHHA